MSQTRGAGAAAVPEGPLHIPNDEQQMKYDVLPGGDVEGTRRAVANGIATTSTMVNRLEMPPGQSSPPRRFTGDHVVYQLEGTVEWDVDGVVYRLAAGDMLYFPARAFLLLRQRRHRDRPASSMSQGGSMTGRRECSTPMAPKSRPAR